MQRLTYLRHWRENLGYIIQSGKLMLVATLLLFLIAMTSGQELDDETAGKNLSLNIYLYETGKALVTGYVEDPGSLIFLKPTQYSTKYAAQYTPNYRYEKDTCQLYTWTDALTMKHGENWSLVFSLRGSYNEYHTVLQLPGNLRLGRINSSTGLKYLVSISNDSLAVDVQGYRVHNPAVSVEYQQPLDADNNINSSISVSNNTGFSPDYLFLIVAFVIGGCLAFFIARRRDTSHEMKSLIQETMKHDDASTPSETAALEAIEKTVPCEDRPHQAAPTEADLQVDFSEVENKTDKMPLPDEGMKKEIEISSEMMAVIETLTPRERAILEALIKYGGRMTQADLRYETCMPKSSVTMTLISLERRKLVTKKEWGRTNVIELSKWFLSKKEQS